MGFDYERHRDKLFSFCSKFFSLIVAICMGFSTIIYLVGVFRFMRSQKAFRRIEVAHFVGLVITVISVVMYFILHFIPKKRYRLMYGLTAVLLCSILMSGHSLGLSAPTVDDCDEKGRRTFFNNTMESIGEIGEGITTKLTNSTVRGSLGQSLGDCLDHQVIFAGSFLVTIFQITALFDVQRLLLIRVKSKTYGERFVEMGIR